MSCNTDCCCEEQVVKVGQDVPNFELETYDPTERAFGKISLEKMAALYAWHGRNHVAHITELRKQNGW